MKVTIKFEDVPDDFIEALKKDENLKALGAKFVVTKKRKRAKAKRKK